MASNFGDFHNEVYAEAVQGVTAIGSNVGRGR